MELELKTERQRQIADLLWSCETVNQVQRVIDTYGHEACVVQLMMVYAAIDDEFDQPSVDVVELIKKIAK